MRVTCRNKAQDQDVISCETYESSVLISRVTVVVTTVVVVVFIDIATAGSKLKALDTA